MANTEQTSDAVRRIVEEVLRRIAAQAGPSPRPAAPAAAAASASAAGSTVVLGERVITLDMLVRLPAGTRQLTVAARAVVTPSARDHAREIGLAIVTAAAPAFATAAPARPLAIAHADCGGDATRRCAAIARAVPAAQQLPPSGLADVVAALAAHAARDGGRSVLLTGRPAVATILANRHPGVRAVAVRDAAGAARAAAECSANLLVVNPADFTGGMERAAADFATRDRTAIPPELATAAPAATPCSCNTHSH
jgi:hypothetical protein